MDTRPNRHRPASSDSSSQPSSAKTRPAEGAASKRDNYVGTIVGESTSREFRLAVAQEAIREQDIIAVDAELRVPEQDGSTPERIRVWAKVQSIERVNPLFPMEAGHELAATHTDPFDTVLSLSREMVTAVCQILGAEPIEGTSGGKLNHLRYPARPATSAYRPSSDDTARIVLGELREKEGRALDIATLSNRRDVDVLVDGHAIVTRHLAILAMTGAGKSWTARRIIEQLADKNYPMVIFDPHGDYTGLKDVSALRERVKLYYAELPIMEEEFDDVVRIVSGLSGEELTAPQIDAFSTLYSATSNLLSAENLSSGKLRDVLFEATRNPALNNYPLGRNLFALSYIAEAAEVLAKQKDAQPRRDLIDLGFEALDRVDARLAGTFGALARKLRRAAFSLREMEEINRSRAGKAAPLPFDRTELVDYGQVSVISLAGYTEVFRATLYTLIVRRLFASRVHGKIRYPFLLVLEEAHNIVPGHAENSEPAIERALGMTKQIAQEGRKFGVGLILISQRPSRLDETTLSQCNSFIIMRMVNPADQNFVRRVIESLGEEEANLLPDLDVGEAILSGQLINFPVLVRIKPPESKGEREEQDAFEALAAIHNESGKGKRANPATINRE
jgi:DNA helicase HerA-like ATPase